MVRKTALSALAGTVVSAALVATALPAHAATSHDPIPGRQGAHWLGRQVNSAGLLTSSGYPDAGLTLDYAFSAARVGATRVPQRVAARLAEVDPTTGSLRRSYVQQYVDFTSSYNGAVSDYPSANAAGKAVAFAQQAGVNPRHWGGMNVLAFLNHHTDAKTGRISDGGSGTDYANTIGQAYAARGLSRARSSHARAAVRFLLAQQCRAGYFTLSFNSNPAATKQSCNARKAPADTDATSIAVVQLLALPKHSSTRAVQHAVAKARHWLVDQQKRSGAFGGGTGTTAPNANSTGLAAWALGHTRAARHAAVWLRRLQARDVGPCGGRLAADLGALAYDPTAYRAGRHDGVTSTSRDQWVRASAQGLAALTELPAPAGRLQVAAAHRVKAGQRLTVHVRNAAPYSRVCVSIAGQHVSHAVSGAGRATVRITVPAGRDHRTLAAVDSDRRRDTVRLTVRR